MWHRHHVPIRQDISRIHQLQQYSGPWRGAVGQHICDSDSESDCGDEEDQESPLREYTQAPRGSSRSSELPPKKSSGASSGGPPSPWGTGETKKRIVAALKNEHSDIHLYYTEDNTTTGCTNIKYAKILEMYAPKHDMKKIRPNLKRLIESKMAMKGPFEIKAKASKEIEPWFTSSKNTSQAYTLLHDLYRFHAGKINSMNAEQIWSSQSLFKQYPLKDFKRYNTNMKKMVSMKQTRAATEEAIYQEDMRDHPQKLMTCRGTPFWDTHAAKKLLIKDVEDGVGQSVGPKELWKTRREYQAFPYDHFRMRVYEARSKQLAGPYWQVKRNKNGRELNRLETDKMRKQWAHGVEMEEMNDMFKQASAL